MGYQAHSENSLTASISKHTVCMTAERTAARFAADFKKADKTQYLADKGCDATRCVTS